MKNSTHSVYRRARQVFILFFLVFTAGRLWRLNGAHIAAQSDKWLWHVDPLQGSIGLTS
jgi:hypothetical protein